MTTLTPQQANEMIAEAFEPFATLPDIDAETEVVDDLLLSPCGMWQLCSWFLWHECRGQDIDPDVVHWEPRNFLRHAAASKQLRDKLADRHDTWSLIRTPRQGFTFSSFDGTSGMRGIDDYDHYIGRHPSEFIAVALCALKSVGIDAEIVGAE